MESLGEIISILNLLGLGGVGLFLYYLYKGLRERISTLTDLAEEQKKVLEAVRTRAEEMDRLTGSYKRALIDFEEMGQKLEQRRNELIRELEAATKKKDEELARLANLQLEEIELKKKSLERLPELEKNLGSAIDAIGKHLRIVSSSEKSLESSSWESPHLFGLDKGRDIVFAIDFPLNESSSWTKTYMRRRLLDMFQQGHLDFGGSEARGGTDTDKE